MQNLASYPTIWQDVGKRVAKLRASQKLLRISENISHSCYTFRVQLGNITKNLVNNT